MSKTNQYLILDRDKTLIYDPGYVHKIEELKFLPGVIAGLQKLRDQGYKFIIIANQSGIARGYFSLEQAQTFNKQMLKNLKAEGLIIEKIYLCPHHPEFSGPCRCRKPEPGLALEAAQDFGFDLRESVFIGDKNTDIEFGRNCGGQTILIDQAESSPALNPDFIVKNFEEVYEILLQLKKSS